MLFQRVKNLADDLLGVFFPDTCRACGQPLADGERFLCLTCLGELLYSGFERIPNNPLEQRINRICPHAIEGSALFLFEHDNPVRPLIHRLKYGNRPDIGFELGRMMGRSLRDCPRFSDYDVLVPVPLHSKRLRKRGYNQALVLCEGISVETGIALSGTTLARTRSNKTQTSLSLLERWKNTEYLFTLADPAALAGKRVLIVDDVFTTGATLASCAETVAGAGPKKIGVFTLASAVF